MTPVIIEAFPAAGEMPSGIALALASIATGTFLILYGITYVFLTGQFKVSFPRAFEILFAGLLGFFAGLLISSFAALVVTALPLSQNSIISKTGFNRESLQDNISYICWFCDSVNRVVSLPGEDTTSEQIISGLLDSVRRKEQDSQNQQTNLSRPGEPNDSLNYERPVHN